MEQENKSAFNMGAARLKHIDEILRGIEHYSSNEDYVWWYKKLNSLRKEIVPFMKKDEREYLKTIHDEAKRVTVQFNFNPPLSNKKRFEEALERLEEYLRDMLNAYDLLMPKKDDPRFAVLQT